MNRTYLAEFLTVLPLFLFAICLKVGLAQRPRPIVITVIEGDSMYQVLPPNAIPAILEPEYVTGAEAAAQMSPEEPVLGLVINGQAVAYSLWQLDHHEIVNDILGGTPIAATW